VRARDGEQVRKAGDREPEVGLRAVRPLLRQRLVAAATDPETLQWSGERVEAGGEDDDVELVLSAAGANPLRRNRLDWRVARVNQENIVLVEGLVVIAVQRLAFGADVGPETRQVLARKRDRFDGPHSLTLGDELVRCQVPERAMWASLSVVDALTHRR